MGSKSDPRERHTPSKVHITSAPPRIWYYTAVSTAWVIRNAALGWFRSYLRQQRQSVVIMMTSSNGNIFRVTGPLCGEFTGPGEFPAQRPVTRSFDVFFDLRLNQRLSKQPRGWWFETPAWSLWRHRNVNVYTVIVSKYVFRDALGGQYLAQYYRPCT